MFRKLGRAFEAVVADVEAGVNSAASAVTREWNDVSVQCPSCGTTLRVPEGAEVFTCSTCSARINNPGLGSRLSYHLQKTGKQVEASVKNVRGQTQSVEITVPSGVRVGETITWTSPGGQSVNVVVPEGVEAGQSFTAQVPFCPATSKKGCVAQTDIAPATLPVARPAQRPAGSAGYGGSGGVAPSAPAAHDTNVTSTSGCGTTASNDNSATVIAGADSEVAETQQAQPHSVSADSGGPITDNIGESSSTSRGGLKHVLRRKLSDLKEKWDTIEVHCPSCETVLEAPKGVKVFACGACGVSINGPSVLQQFDYHTKRITQSIDVVASDLIKQKSPVEVKVPPGVRPGQSITVQVGKLGRGELCVVTVPEGVEAGQTFTAMLPTSALVGGTVTVAAQAAPEEPPVAEALTEIASSPAASPAAATGASQAGEDNISAPLLT
eukprot:TRINITY_DN56220_c0_g1_i1.p1 TRINITY_DN56220_c0_g1~~TRINITY_DN56220_c0_g1_i1.p1  ORF type:complete len:439 (+),score=73.34 TRINITY_DN56220_c0_g1_i1:172-1488(+)